MRLRLPTVIAITLAVALSARAAELTSDGSQAVAAEPPPAASQAPAKVATASRDQHALDRLQLDPTAITGNRELPKVMSIVPWKSAEPPAGPDRPMGSLIEEVLAPVDRDEFRREVTYFRDLTTQSAPVSQEPASPSPGATQP